MVRKAAFHHVFLSFRSDVRHTFTCFLYDALKEEGIEPFMDTVHIDAGDALNKTIRKGIKKSMSAIVIFSKDFASSNSCLNEMNLLVDRKKTSKLFILPILYDVSTRQNKENFAAALENHKEKYGEEQVTKWKEAFDVAKDILSMRFGAEKILPQHFQEQRTEFIVGIMEKFRKRFEEKYPEHPLPPSNNSTSSMVQPNADYMEMVQPNAPLSGYMEKCPPGAADKVVLYTSSIGVASTRRACNDVKDILADHEVKFEERDVWEDEKFQNELVTLVEELSYPRLFVRGRDIGGFRQVKKLYDCGELEAIIEYHKQQL